MKKFTLALIFLFLITGSFAQKKYWQQQVNYQIDVSLNDTLYTLDGFVKMDYTNNAPDTLSFIW
ncbi:MAG: M1 family peptidase, partial [Ferruginibacter sp.]